MFRAFEAVREGGVTFPVNGVHRKEVVKGLGFREGYPLVSKFCVTVHAEDAAFFLGLDRVDFYFYSEI